MNGCPICKEFIWGPGHKCEQMWYCLYSGEDDWPDAETMIEEGFRVYMPDASKAATTFADRYCSDGNYYPNNLEVFVMADVLNERGFYEILRVDVRQEPVPSFWVVHWEKKEVEEK